MNDGLFMDLIIQRLALFLVCVPIIYGEWRWILENGATEGGHECMDCYLEECVGC